MEQRLNIFEYSNYRKFLKEYFRLEKDQNPKFSYRYFSRKAGFISPVFPYLVAEGKKNLTKDSILKLSTALNFGRREQQYFETLVSYNQAKNAETRRYYFELMGNLRKAKIGTQLDDDKFEYISKWYYPAIRELVYLPNFSDNPLWLKSALKNRVTVQQARQAIETLLRLGLLRKREDGTYEQVDQNLITEDNIVHEAMYSFQLQILSLARETLTVTHADERQFSGLMMPLSEKQLKEVKNMVREFEDSVIRYLDSNPDVPMSVFHLNTTLFSLTEKVKG